MSWLSKATGIGINPLKGKIKIDPLKALGTALTVGSMGSLGPVAAIASKIPGAASLGGLATKIGGVIPGPLKSAGGAIVNAAKGAGAAAAKRGIGVSDLLQGGLEAYGAVKGIQSANASGKAAASNMGKQGAIADALSARGGAMADAASKGLLARLQAGPRATPNFSQFVDRANPFAGQFAQPNPAAPVAAAPMGATPILPPPPRRRLLTAGAPIR
jgi:hypothetical protein